MLDLGLSGEKGKVPPSRQQIDQAFHVGADESAT